MNKFDFDEVIGSVENTSAKDSFRDQLLIRSQNTLTRSRFKRRVIRASGTISCVLLIAAGVFLCGRISSDGLGEDIHIAADGENVVVSAELVAWLDAGRFFEQLNMPDRAANAYKNASKMIPAQIAKPQALISSQTVQLAALLQRAETVANENEKINSMESNNCMLATITISK